MAGYFNQKQLSQRGAYEQKYNTSRMQLLLVFVFTAINLMLLVANADSYFLFSAFIPYFMTLTGMLMCGLLPDEFYIEGTEGLALFDNSFFITLLVISIVITLLYLLAWFMSGKNRGGWLIFALVLFGLDTAGMIFLGGVSLDSAVDIIFHVWVLYYLIIGINAHYKLKKLPPEEELASPEVAAQVNEAGSDPFSANTQSSTVIRIADNDVKHRVLLEAQVANYAICYRRVKRTNELVVNGNVYDEIEGLVEHPHTLEARIEGHLIEASFNGSHSVIFFDGKEIAKKLRLF